MIPLAAMSANRAGNPWLASIYAGVLAAIAAYAASYFLQADQLVPAVVALLLTGAGPVLGYALATGRIGGSIGGMIGGIIGAIPVLDIILWPVLVGALTSRQSIGKLFLGNLIGIILGLAVFFAMASTMGQDPSWFAAGVIVSLAVWAGTCGAVMTSWAKS
ncbi:MAG: hypothetical protein R2867_30495 [Caldilineaceae bacterium]